MQTLVATQGTAKLDTPATILAEHLAQKRAGINQSFCIVNLTLTVLVCNGGARRHPWQVVGDIFIPAALLTEIYISSLVNCNIGNVIVRLLVVAPIRISNNGQNIALIPQNYGPSKLMPWLEIFGANSANPTTWHLL